MKYPWPSLTQPGDFFLIPGRTRLTQRVGIRSMALGRGFRVSVRQFRASCKVERRA